MEFKFEITEEDYLQFNLYHSENSPSQKKLVRVLRWVIPIVFASIIYYVGTAVFHQPSLYWLIISLLFSGAWIIWYPRFYKKQLKKQVSKMLSEGDNSALFGEKTMVIEGNEIKVFDKYASTTVVKENIKAINYYDDMIIIYLSSITAQIIPTRNLVKDEQKQLITYLDQLVEKG
ncbi:hypothetical protein SAMN04488134_103251 [Amphibacillus marinus]|uniref:Uncharacterized protein n=1 Tax=Amphibacillus marinus TaxID=872970 RepID=A0A1H8LLM3_9BACI|nr:YcxB family protein [Amphibacillus marinus]SEO05979.1 hypothetical protein SAMN04488134_103251 [Amphibacillus marinus]